MIRALDHRPMFDPWSHAAALSGCFVACDLIVLRAATFFFLFGKTAKSGRPQDSFAIALITLYSMGQLHNLGTVWHVDNILNTFHFPNKST